MISYIIPAHNEEAWIGRCLSAIRTSTSAVNTAHEVIVVDDASTDTTAALAEEHGARVIFVGLRDRHRRGTHLLLSATLRHVPQNAPCPVQIGYLPAGLPENLALPDEPGPT